ncbi:MAG: RloB domain-containing protein [Gammaproteobacteria bacterium]|nr:RloB domain-containing protein [Gammaproteobacteria bacterium]
MTKNRKTKPVYKKPNPVILIVCEGEITEPAYFRQIKKKLRANIDIIKGCGSNPKNILHTAKQKYHDFKYSQIFCVFDKDSHHHYQSAINDIKQLRNKKTNPIPIKAIHSAPCIEYWFLLHFTYTSSPFQRTEKKSTGDLCVKQLKEHIPNYDKKREIINEIFPELDQKLSTAIKNAKQIQKASRKEEFDEPYTNAHELIEYLHDLPKKNRDILPKLIYTYLLPNMFLAFSLRKPLYFIL